MPYESNSHNEQTFLDVLFQIPSLASVENKSLGNDEVDSRSNLFPSSFRRLFPFGELASRGYLEDYKEWANFENEKRSWEVFQECLDTFVQRLSVTTDPKEKQMLRKWYEFLLEIGDNYFGRLRS